MADPPVSVVICRTPETLTLQAGVLGEAATRFRAGGIFDRPRHVRKPLQHALLDALALDACGDLACPGALVADLRMPGVQALLQLGRCIGLAFNSTREQELLVRPLASAQHAIL